MIRSGKEIFIDIDRDRILEIVEASYDFVVEFAQCEFFRSKDDILSEVKAILDSNRVSTVFNVDFSNTYIEDFQLRVDVRRKEVLGITRKFRKKKNKLNSFLRTL
jgi:hypothetical protein